MPGHRSPTNIDGEKSNNTKLCRADSKQAIEPPNWTGGGSVALGTYLAASGGIEKCERRTEREHLC